MSEVFNPWTLPRPELREDEREYSDRRHPGVSVKIRFREMNPILEGEALRLYGEYFDKWVKLKGGGNGKEPTPQVLPTPIPVRINEVVLDQFVLLQAMHAPDEGAPRYGILEWAGFAVNMPDAFREMLRVCRELNQEQEQERGNASQPESSSGDESSNQLSSTDNLTPNGCSTSPDASGASPGVCEPSARGLEFPPESVETTQEPSTCAG